MLTSDTGKRYFDVMVAAIALVISWPLLGAAAVLIKLDSRGPVLYQGVRIGRGGKAFRIYKFRTMVPGAEALGTTTRLDDPRITRIGHVLRRYKLDELPQIFNVLRGEMSIVGPRPEVAEHTSVYTDEERIILSIRPGITDFASIRFADMAGELGSEDPHREYLTRVREEKNRLRLHYVRTRSFWLDLKIIVLTIWTIVKRALPSVEQR